MTRQDYERLRAAIEKRYEEDLAALDRVYYRLSCKHREMEELLPHTETAGVYDVQDPGTIRVYVKKLADVLPAQFTKRDVQEALLHNFPDVFPEALRDSWFFKQRVSQTLANIAAGGEGNFIQKVGLRPAQVGVGRRCNIYQFDPSVGLNQ